MTLESDRLKQETGSRAELLTRIDAETRMVEEERAKAEQINKKYRQQLSDYKVGICTVLNQTYSTGADVFHWSRRIPLEQTY